jgi:hypothetical protein
VGVLQSNYLPWRGYFDIIRSVDLLVFHDDLQYTKGDWRNRNKLKTTAGLKWMTVPVRYLHTRQRICDTEIDYGHKWERRHLNLFREGYASASNFEVGLSLLSEGISGTCRTISELNVRMIDLVCEYLEISTPRRMSSDLNLKGHKSERLLDLMHKVGGTTYLSGPSGKTYIDVNLFRRAGIGLEFKTYDYDPYPQLWGGFINAVSVLDLIANMGSESVHYLSSRTPNEEVLDRHLGARNDENAT